MRDVGVLPTAVVLLAPEDVESTVSARSEAADGDGDERRDAPELSGEKRDGGKLREPTAPACVPGTLVRQTTSSV